MRLLRIPAPFDHPDFLYEVKFDRFRALAHVHGHHCKQSHAMAIMSLAAAERFQELDDGAAGVLDEGKNVGQRARDLDLTDPHSAIGSSARVRAAAKANAAC